MFTVIDKTTKNPNTITMGNMKPGDIGRIIDVGKGVKSHFGELVMRTLSTTGFEVMNLTCPTPDSCWSVRNGMLVELLKPGTEIILKVV